MNRLGPIVAALLLFSGSPLLAQEATPQGVDVPADSDIPLEDRLDLTEVTRDALLHSGQFDPRSARALALQANGRPDEAEALYRLMLQEEMEAPDRSDRALAWIETSLGRLLWQQRREDEAEAMLRSSFARVEWRPNSHGLVYWASSNLGGLLGSQGRFDEAEILLRRAVKDTGLRQFRGTAYSMCSQLGLAYMLFAQSKSGELAALLPSIEAQITRFGWDGTSFETSLRRLQCLTSGQCRLDEKELRAEASRTIALAEYRGD